MIRAGGFRALISLALILGCAPAMARARPLAQAAGAGIAPENPAACADLALVPEVALGEVRADFEHNTKYSIEVDSTEVKDQCLSRSCWIYSGVSNIEQRILRHTGRKVDLSEEYLIVQGLRLRALEALDTPDEQFSPGGSAGNVDWLVDTYGIVPDSVWRPRVDFKPEAISKKMYYFINERLARYHLSMHDAKNDVQRLALTEAAKADLLKLIEAYSGPLPGSFAYEGVHYDSPRDFAARALPPDPRPTVMYEPPAEKLPPELDKALDGKGENGPVPHIPPHYAIKRLPVEEIGEKIRNALAHGESVRIGYESAHEFIDDKTGIMSIAAFHIPKGFEPPPKSYRRHFDFKGVGHAVEVVGVDVAPDGHIIKLKIKNSHGTGIGDRGYMHMYWDYFKAFMTSAYIREGATN